MHDDISVAELKSRLDKKDDFVFIDVREQSEYEEQNLGAKLIPLQTIPTKLQELEQFKESEIVIHCRSGKRSASAQQFLIQNGFQNVRNVVGGILAYNDL